MFIVWTNMNCTINSDCNLHSLIVSYFFHIVYCNFATVIVCHFLCFLMAFDCQEIKGLLTYLLTYLHWVLLSMFMSCIVLLIGRMTTTLNKWYTTAAAAAATTQWTYSLHQLRCTCTSESDLGATCFGAVRRLLTLQQRFITVLRSDSLRLPWANGIAVHMCRETIGAAFLVSKHPRNNVWKLSGV